MQLNPQQPSSSRFKLTQTDINNIHNNPLNQSTSKMQYSIPKSKRWTHEKSDQNSKSKFYDLPELKSSRSTSFGYGNKIDFSKTNLITPSPLNYTINRQFDTSKDKKSGITFGAGRDIVKNVNTFGIKPYKVPGPQDYHPNKSTIEISPPKYSLGGRVNDLKQKWPRSIPGPGQYNTIQVTKNNNNISVSTLQSSPAISFSKHKRTPQYEQKLRSLKVPGPGQYKMDNFQTTKFHINGGRKFGSSQRKGIANKSITPGPGSYKLFSQFLC